MRAFPLGRYWPLFAWAALAVGALFLRALWPVDETRYVAAAWEMWRRGDFLVPYLHGAPYSHKPPLLFWMMQAGWAMGGVNDWWPRLVSPLLALFSGLLVLRLAHRLWPDDPTLGPRAVEIYCGAFLFGVLFTLVGFDSLLTCCTLIALLGFLRAAQGETVRGLAWAGLGIGLGVLAKGPVILLHVLPVAVLAPWWADSVRAAKVRWYLGVLGAVLLGAALALLWAIPAGYSGGAAYRNAIFWGQTAGRVTASFAHRAPVWWYLPWLPVLLFPWLVWPSLLRGLRDLVRAPSGATRFLLAWLLPVLIGFSLISGKQARYLLPLLPGFALLAAAALARVPARGRRFDLALPAAGIALFAVAWIYVLRHPHRLGGMGDLLPPAWPAVVMALLAAVLFWAGRATLATRVRALSIGMLLLMASLYGGVMPFVNAAYDPRSIARYLSELEARGVALGYVGKYQAQFDFYGRLRGLRQVDDPARWRREHPEGRLAMFAREASRGPVRPDFERRYRGGYLQVWRAADAPLVVSRSVDADTE